ncbi:MAG: hypothetical protein ABIQ39_07470, partial [Ilumatobacteraceae bacterium]
AAAALAAIPLATGYAVWWLVFGADPAAATHAGGRSQVAGYALHGLDATFAGLTVVAGLGGVALLATLAVTVWRRSGGPSAQLIALGATAALMFAGIGWQRVGFGMENAASSRYVYMGAMLLAPGFALAVDRLAVLAAPALHAGRLLLVVAMLVNTGHLLVHATAWSKRSTCERTALSLLAGSPEAAAAADRSLQPLAFSPDVRLADLDRLVAEGAFRARVPADDTERSLVHAVLTVPSKTCLPT